MRRRLRLVSALEFRCCRVIPLAAEKLTLESSIERICITMRDDLSPRSHRAVLLQVTHFIRDCKDRGYRSRAGQMEKRVGL